MRCFCLCDWCFWISSLLVIPFLMSVLRRLRKVLFTGLIGSEPWSSELRQAPILYHFGQADNPRRRSSSDDESMYFAFALHNGLHVKGVCWVQTSFTFFPREPIEGQSLPWGRSFSSFTKGWELTFLPHPTSNIKLSKYFFAPRPSCCHDLAGTGRTVGAGLAPRRT
jgi:hypothetical protein